jgi:hypothetical protein
LRGGDENLTKWLDPTVRVLYSLSNTLGEGVSLVCFREWTPSEIHSFLSISQVFSPAKVISAGVGVLLSVRILHCTLTWAIVTTTSCRQLWMFVQARTLSSTSSGA